MKLTVRFRDTRAFYALSTWEWDESQYKLFQMIPLISKARFQMPNQKFTWDFHSGNYGPSLQLNQQIWLDETLWYVRYIEVVPPSDKPELIYAYSLSIEPGEPVSSPEVWSTDVKVKSQLNQSSQANQELKK